MVKTENTMSPAIQVLSHARDEHQKVIKTVTLLKILPNSEEHQIRTNQVDIYTVHPIRLGNINIPAKAYPDTLDEL